MQQFNLTTDKKETMRHFTGTRFEYDLTGLVLCKPSAECATVDDIFFEIHSYTNTCASPQLRHHRSHTKHLM